MHKLFNAIIFLELGLLPKDKNNTTILVRFIVPTQPTTSKLCTKYTKKGLAKIFYKGHILQKGLMEIV